MKKLLLVLFVVFSVVTYCKYFSFMSATGSLYIRTKIKESKKLSLPATASLMLYTNKIYTN